MAENQMTSEVDGITIGWIECSQCYTHYTSRRCAQRPLTGRS
jgi:hypothetical protein